MFVCHTSDCVCQCGGVCVNILMCMCEDICVHEYNCVHVTGNICQ